MWTWVSLVLTGETVGFVVPGLAWFAAWKAGLPPLAAAAIVVPAGACEGAVLRCWPAPRLAYGAPSTFVEGDGGRGRGPWLW